jgi:hypothetical protein
MGLCRIHEAKRIALRNMKMKYIFNAKSPRLLDLMSVRIPEIPANSPPDLWAFR